MSNDITFDKEGFISQTLTSKLTGIPRSTLQRYIKQNHGQGCLLNENNQLNEDLFIAMVQMGTSKGLPQCVDLTNKLMKGGVRVLFYGLAGQQTPEQQEIKRLQNQTPKLLGVGYQANRRSLHEQREQLFKDGLCHRVTFEVTHFFYPVNDRGLAAGYENIGKGTRKTIKL